MIRVSKRMIGDTELVLTSWFESGYFCIEVRKNGQVWDCEKKLCVKNQTSANLAEEETLFWNGWSKRFVEAN